MRHVNRQWTPGTDHACGRGGMFERPQIRCRTCVRPSDVHPPIDEIAVGGEAEKTDIRQTPALLARCARLGGIDADEVFV